MSVRAAISAVIFGAILFGLPGVARAAPETVAVNDVPVASEVRLAGDEARTRLIVDVGRKVDVRVFTLANPYRVVVDLPQIAFQFPEKTGEKGRGLIKAFRYGLVMQGGSRLVIDLARPARVEKAFVLDPANDQPARLVLELGAVERDVFLRTIALENRAPEPRRQELLAARSGSEKSGSEKSGSEKSGSDKSGSDKPGGESGDPRPLVVIDPGHGGMDN